MRMTARVHFDSQHHDALVLRFPRGLGKLGFHFIDELRRRDLVVDSRALAETGLSGSPIADAAATAMIADTVAAVEPEPPVV